VSPATSFARQQAGVADADEDGQARGMDRTKPRGRRVEKRPTRRAARNRSRNGVELAELSERGHREPAEAPGEAIDGGAKGARQRRLR
jgi:hypothetical protein